MSTKRKKARKMTKRQRSAHMAKIKSKRTKPEMAVHNHLKGNKVEHSMWPRGIHGNPDVLVGADKVVFVNGCFWHGCPQHYRRPKTNSFFWDQKIARNIERQGEVVRELKRSGYKVVIVWEHEIKKAQMTDIIARIAK